MKKGGDTTSLDEQSLGGETSGCACANIAHNHRAKKRNVSIIHFTAIWNAVEGSGMVRGRFVLGSEVEPQTLVLFLEVFHE